MDTNALLNQGEEFNKGLKFGLEAIITMDRSLTGAEIQDVYGVHRTTAYRWYKADVYDFDKGHTRVLFEFLKRYNPKNTFEFMEKYKLESDNTLEYISEKLLINIDMVDSMYNSKITWRKKILKNLLKINKKLFQYQVEMVKDIVKKEDQLVGKTEQEDREKLIIEKIKLLVLENVTNE